MADNVAITAGSGTNVATDDVAGVHYQRVKLVNGTLDATDAIPGDATNGLDVDVTRVSGTVTVDSELPAAAALADATANPTAPAVGAFIVGWNGTTWDRLKSDTTNGLDVDVTRVSGTVTVDSELPAAAALADAAANPTAPMVGATLLGYNGTTWDRLRSDTTNGLDVDVTRVTGTVTVDSELPAAAALADNTANPTVPAVGAFNMVFDGTNWDRQPGTSASGAFVQGDVAHDLPIAANPLLLGGRASAAAPADVSADGDAVRAWFLRNGAQAQVLTAAGALIGGDATNGLDVDVTRIIPGTTATALGKAEDDAHNSGDVGVMALAVAKATPVALGADGDYTPLQVDSTNRLWVRPAPVQVRISVTPTISTSPAYTSGDVLGGLQTISNAARVSGGSGVVQSICVLDKTQAQRAAMDILFFDRSVTVASDNAAVAMSDGDMANCLGVISIGPYNTAWPGTPLNSFSTLINVGLPFVLNGTDLFAVAVVRATPTYVGTTDLVFIYTILQD